MKAKTEDFFLEIGKLQLQIKCFFSEHPFTLKKLWLSLPKKTKYKQYYTNEKKSAQIPKIARELRSFLLGECQNLSIKKLDSSSLSDFEKKILFLLRRVKRGQTVSYGKLAEMAGYPRATRAVASVLARNPFPLFFPCHRVIRANGDIGNFSAGGGKTLKRRLLLMEKSAV